MTDTKDMGIFGFGKDEDWKGYLAFGVLLLLIIGAYVYYSSSGSIVQKNTWSNFFSNHLALIIVSTLLVLLIVYQLIAKWRGWWPFNTVPTDVDPKTLADAEKIISNHLHKAWYDPSTGKILSGTAADDAKADKSIANIVHDAGENPADRTTIGKSVKNSLGGT